MILRSVTLIVLMMNILLLLFGLAIVLFGSDRLRVGSCVRTVTFGGRVVMLSMCRIVRRRFGLILRVGRWDRMTLLFLLFGFIGLRFVVVSVFIGRNRVNLRLVRSLMMFLSWLRWSTCWLSLLLTLCRRRL